jgi:hypothetical protein
MVRADIDALMMDRQQPAGRIGESRNRHELVTVAETNR